jgi:hypothetical protein
MPADDPKIVCLLCNQGHVLVRMEELAFHQSSNKGNVYCRVMVPIGICDNCGAKSLDETAEKIMDDAFQRAYQKLP